MKRVLALILALIMVLGLATTAFAAYDPSLTTTITMADEGDHKADNRDYEAYQILLASVDETDKEYAYEINTKYLSCLVTAFNETTEKYNKDNTIRITEQSTIDNIVAALNTLKTAELMRHFGDAMYREIREDGLEHDAKWTGRTVTVPQGYWLIVDVTNFDQGNTDDNDEKTEESNSLVMIDTVGDKAVSIQIKPDGFITYKNLDDENDSIVGSDTESEDGENWQDVADYDIGDSVPYQIHAVLPQNVVDYEYYSFVIQDTISAGLTFEPESFKLVVNQTEIPFNANHFKFDIVEHEDGSSTLYLYPNYGYTKVAKDADGKAVTVEPNMVDGGDYLKLFPEGTPHTVINGSAINFTYTCKLNENAVIGNKGNTNDYTLKFSNNPYGDSFGETVKDTNIVLTYKFIVNKTDGENPLKGADFTLFKFNADANQPNVPGHKELCTTEEQKAAYDNLIAAGKEHSDGANAWGTYVAVPQKTTTNAGANAAVGEATTFAFNGLDDGYYKLVETTVPAGYNKVQDIYFKVINAHITNLDGQSIGNTLTVQPGVGCPTPTIDQAGGTISMDVVNKSGAELPSTGGMGTTMLYITGTLLVMFAVVMLVTKKRMGTEA